MTFTPEEIQKLETMFMFLVQKKHNISDGNCGFHLNDLQPILDNLEAQGKIKLRPTINSSKYFINSNTLKNEH